MKNEELIKAIIREGYDISLDPQNLSNLDYILTKNQTENINDYKKIIEYLEWYTQKTIKQGYDNFKIEYTIEIYARYLEAIEDIPMMEIMPRKDMYYIKEAIVTKQKELKKTLEKELQKQLTKETINEEYKKTGNCYYWDLTEELEP